MPEDDSSHDFSTLSTEQLQQRLSSPTLPTEERDGLVEELSLRFAEELLADRGAPSASDPHSKTHSFEPPRVAKARPRAAAAASAQGNSGGHADGARASGVSSPIRPTGTGPNQQQTSLPSGPSRRGFRRSAAALVALATVALAAWVALTGLQPDDGSGGPGAGLVSDEPQMGPAGEVQVSWTAQGVFYTAVVDTNGQKGTATVTFVDPIEGVQRTVRQDLSFEEIDGEYAYQGSGPRDAVTDAYVDYSADIFYLEPTSTGWYFVEVCDEQGMCGPVAQ